MGRFPQLQEHASDNAKITFFRKHFLSVDSWIFAHFRDHSLVGSLMEACSLAIMASRDGNSAYRDNALSLYVSAIKTVRAALGDSQRAVEDTTLVATILLCLFEVSTPISILYTF